MRPVGGEKRARVTVAFTDLVGSSALGERLDPEALRRLLEEYFLVTADVYAAHGGHVREFIGDTIVAVFGVPEASEDDAVRAVRAASAVHRRIAELNDALERGRGVRLRVRTAIDSGQVLMTSDPAKHSFVLGDPVNVAARVQQLVPAGEIWLGEGAAPLVARVARLEAVPSVAVQGRPDPVRAWRLGELAPRALAGVELPFIGRAAPLAALRSEWDRATLEGTGVTVVVVGTAGEGKSRLAREFVDRLPGPRVVWAHLAAEPRGGSFAPLGPITRQLVGVSADARGVALRDAVAATCPPGDRLLAERLWQLAEGSGTAPVDELGWAVRRLLASAASEGPVVVVLDDLHRAEPTLLDLIDGIDGGLADAPVMILGLAGPELLDERPGLRERSFTLQPLKEGEARRLASAAAPNHTEEEIEGVVAKAHGNPLFIRELLVAIGEGEGPAAGLAGSTTIRAVLSARLERLSPREREIAGGAAVAGESFSQELVEAALGDGARPAATGSALEGLSRTLFIEHDADGYRFHHELLRDAAYRSLPLERRAEIHQRVADWYASGGDRSVANPARLVGHHLERAHRCLTAMQPTDPVAIELAARAAERLAAAGLEASRSSDERAAVDLLARAEELLPAGDERRARILPALGRSLAEAGHRDEAREVLDEAMRRSHEQHDVGTQARAFLTRDVLLDRHTDGDRLELVERETDRLIPELEALGDFEALSEAWSARGLASFDVGRMSDADRCRLTAAGYARKAGDRWLEAQHLGGRGSLLLHGPTPAPEGLDEIRRLFPIVETHPRGRMNVLLGLAGLSGLAGRDAEARELLADARTMAQDLGWDEATLGTVDETLIWIELAAGDPAAADVAARRLVEAPSDDSWARASAVSHRLLTLSELGREEDGEDLIEALERQGDRSHYFAAAYSRILRGVLASRRGYPKAGERSARDGIERLAATDRLVLHGLARLKFAEILRSVGKRRDAVSALEDAAALFEQKGAVPFAERTRALLGGTAARPA